MRSSFTAYIVLALAAVAYSAPTSNTNRIVLRDGGDGAEAQSGASGPANGGSVTNSGSGTVANAFGSGENTCFLHPLPLLNGHTSGNAGNGGESTTGDAQGGNGGNGGCAAGDGRVC